MLFLGECVLPENTSNLELTTAGRDSSDNTSNLSLTIVLHCRDGFTPVNDQKAVCLSNGTWVPDLEEFECHNTTGVIPSEILFVCIAISSLN